MEAQGGAGPSDWRIREDLPDTLEKHLAGQVQM